MRVEADGNAKFRVLVNGIDVTNECYKADDESGLAWLYVRDKDGHFYRDGDGPAQEVVSGRVEIFLSG